MSAVIYYLVVLPLSKAPLWLSYRVADLFYLILLSVFPYRKKVIERNMQAAFPEKRDAEIRKLRRRFYRHFADMLIEGIHGLSISEPDLKKRFRIENPELMQELYASGKSTLIVSAHYMNWEWMNSLLLQMPYTPVAIGTPVKEAFWDKKLNQRRQRFGVKMISAKKVIKTMEELRSANALSATLVLADQAPLNSSQSYWTEFLHQPTPVAFGTEHLANAYDMAVVFYLPEKTSRGKYSVRLQLLTSEPHSLDWGELTEMHLRLLEQRVIDQPEYWLWSHKRWKRKVPENMEALVRTQRAKFNARYRTEHVQ